MSRVLTYFNWVNNVDRGIKIIFLLFLLFQVILLRPVLHKYDPVGYYSTMRSVVIDGNINIADEFEHFGFGGLFLFKTNTPYPAQPWSVGSSILWSPFFLIAHSGVMLANHLGWSIPADGYSIPYLRLVSFGSTLYALIGLLLIFQMIRYFYSSPIAAMSVISVWLASPLVFYMYSHPMMSHANDMFAYSLLLWAWWRLRKSGKIWPNYALAGASAGLAALIRNQNAVLAVLILIFLVFEVIRQRIDWRGGLLAAAIFSISWWMVFFPQLYIWHATFGVWFPGNPYGYVGGGNFYQGFPWIIEVLFSDNRGLFVWNPLIFFSIAGLFFFLKKDLQFGMFLLLSFVTQLAIIGSWDHWHGDSAFGQRFFVNLSPVFMFGLAALIDKISKKISDKTIVALCGIFILWNFLLIVQYAMGTVPRGGATDLWALAQNQFLVIPTNLKRIIGAWWHLK